MFLEVHWTWKKKKKKQPSNSSSRNTTLETTHLVNYNLEKLCLTLGVFLECRLITAVSYLVIMENVK